MVTFEIQSSPDDERLGETTFHFESFTLGGSRKADLFIEDPDIQSIHLLFKLRADGLLINSSSEHFYYSNSKKIKGTKLHKVGDTIKVGTTTFIINRNRNRNINRSRTRSRR